MQNNNIKGLKAGNLLGIVIVLIGIFFISSLGSSTDETSKLSDTGKPDDIELMTYAQTVLDDNLNNIKYSRNTSDYTFINTNLRYKIEGKVTVNSLNEKFFMIIEFDDESYKSYTLISLQVGDERIY
jgi:hypothetical protein